MPRMMPKVFISYSHKDEVVKDFLISHLNVLKLDVWDDRKIEAGENWFLEIEKAIASAKIAVLLISRNFLTSKFIEEEEIPRLLEQRQNKGLIVIPFIIEPCAWKRLTWLKKFQARPKDGKALSAFRGHRKNEVATAFVEELDDMLNEFAQVTNKTDSSEKAEINYLPPEKIDLSKLPSTDSKLFGREKELKKLADAWENPKTRVLSFIAWGGVGKSALVNEWLNRMDDQNFQDAALVYGHSFYSQGTREDTQASADSFINDALKWFDCEIGPSSSAFEKGRALAAQITKKKTLLILDGLEPLQYPPGEMYGNLKDQAMQAMLRGLARSMKGLCIITSRAPVENLKNTDGRMTFAHQLKNLSEKAGLALLKSYDLKGPDIEFKKATREYQGHALALRLVGSYLNIVHHGDIRKRDLIPTVTKAPEQGGHARRVMESYEQWFEKDNKPELDILYLMGLFDRPASMEAIDILKKEPPIPGLTQRLANLSFADWQISLKNLQTLSLLAKSENTENNDLDCHPLIREHFGEKLQKEKPKTWQEAHSRLYEYYKNLPEKELPDTLEEMEPLFIAVRHGCLAGRHQEAFDDILWERIRRGQQAYVTKSLGGFGAYLACLSTFFNPPWNRPVSGLTEPDKAVVLSWAGYALRAIGRLQEAKQPMKAGLELRRKQENWKDSAAISNNLSELILTLGHVKTSQDIANQCIEFADRSKDDFWMEGSRTAYADAFFQGGYPKEAEKLFLEAENMQKKRLPEVPYLYSFSGYLYCNLLLSSERYQEVLDRAKTTLEYKEEHWYSLISIALDQLSIGKALLLQSLQKKSSNLSEAAEFLNLGVKGLRKAGAQYYLPLGLLTLASLYRHQNTFPSAWWNLDEAQEIAIYGSMKLHLTDYYLEACRLIRGQLAVDNKQLEGYKILEQGEVFSLSRAEMEAKFQEFLGEAECLIEECGYHRKDGELAELKGV